MADGKILNLPPRRMEETVCMGELRWSGAVLQQKWRILTWRKGEEKPAERDEWRDVPVVSA